MSRAAIPRLAPRSPSPLPHRGSALALTLALGLWSVCECPAFAQAATPERVQEEIAGASGPASSAPEDASPPAWDVDDPPGAWQWRTIVIDTEETTWSNLDVSPDGSTIVFDMLGDLYTVPIRGGEATALTEGVSWSYQPRYSPDGGRIAFISDRDGGDNLWVMNADGTEPIAVTEEKEHLVHNPWWSADGHYLLGKKSFMSTRSIPAGEIWLFHVGGGGGVQLVERPHGPIEQKNIAEPSYSPDGRYVYYSQDLTPGWLWEYGKDSTTGIFGIRRLDTETGEAEDFVRGPGGAVRPTPSPDGRYLAFVRRLPGLISALYLKDLANGREWALYDRFERDLQETSGSEGNAPAFAWTPDSQSLVFWSGGKIRRVWVEERRAEVIPIRVRTERRVAPALRFPVEVAPEEFPVRMLRWTTVSPDGSQAVFQALGHLWITDLATGERRRLTRQQEHFELHPAFSRDGRWVVFTTWHDQELGSVRVIGVDGRGERVLTTEPGHYVEPQLSPDGDLVVYRKIAGGYLLSPFWSREPGIYRVRAGGGTPERVVQDGVAPHFAVRSDRIYLSRTVERTQRALVSVDLDGRDERAHLQGEQVTEFSVSPDGRWVAFTEEHEAYLAPFPRAGRKLTLGKGTRAFPVRRVSGRSGSHLHWSGGAARLHWSHGPTLYTRELTDAFAFLEGAPEELPEPVEEGVDLGFTALADRPQGTIALVGGRLVTMRDALQGVEEILEEGTVVVTGNRIVAVGPIAEVEIPTGAQVFDVSGRTVIPGLVDVHAHGAQAQAGIVPQQSWIQLSNLSFGVTTIHDPSNPTQNIFAAAELQRAGRIVAPRMFSTGTILYGAHVPGARAEVEGYEDALFHVRRQRDAGAISVKSYQLPRRDQRQQLVAAGRELGVMVVPEAGMKFQHNMTEIVDGHTGIEHSTTLKHLYQDVLDLWSATEVGYTPTFVVSFGGLEGEKWFYQHDEVWANERLMRYVPRSVVEPRAMRRDKAPEDHFNHVYVARSARDLMARGVSVQIGAHGQREGLAAHWELWMMEQGGFTPWEALRGGTLGGAWYVGLDGDIGSLEPGKLADLVVIDGNPLEDLRRSEHVLYTMLGGRLYEAATMNQVAPEEIPRRPFYFEEEGGDTIHPGTLEWLEEHGRFCRH